MSFRYGLGVVLISLLIYGCEGPVDNSTVQKSVNTTADKEVVAKILVGQDLLALEKVSNPERFAVITKELQEQWKSIPADAKTSEANTEGLRQRLAIFEKYFPALSEKYENNKDKYNLNKTVTCSSDFWQCSVCGYIYATCVGGVCFDDLDSGFTCPECGSSKDMFEATSNPGGWDWSDKYVCSKCGYIYDFEIGDSNNGIPAGTAFYNLPDDWVCPVCGAVKYLFIPY